MLKHLASTDRCIIGDLSEEIPLGRTTINQHLKELKDIGLIQGETEGVKTKYCLMPEKAKDLHNKIQDFLSLFDKDDCAYK